MNTWNLTDEKCDALMEIWRDEEEKLALMGVKPVCFREEPTDTYLDENEESFL